MYDAIVIGASCTGSPTAMLLARRGHRVLHIDRARFPSDTMSAHIIHPGGLAALRRRGLLDDLVAAGCPAWPTLRADCDPARTTQEVSR
jgi:2-polyprenyl-6-methoxyphenol hydroxylase-like FAD-dependent oxidoreductase